MEAQGTPCLRTPWLNVPNDRPLLPLRCLNSQDKQPPLTPSRAWTPEVECRMPAHSTNPNSCSTGPALWEFSRKNQMIALPSAVRLWGR